MDKINIIKLVNKQGMEVSILNLGAIIHSIKFPIHGNATEMTMNYDDVEQYKTDPFHIGATAGRFANRIANGKFSIEETEYQLSVNNNGNCLHGGFEGFAHKLWSIEQQTNNSVSLTLISPDGDQGFPGELTANVIYTLTNDNTLTIDFFATTDKSTVINLCNHCYFNLGENNIYPLSLKLKCNHVLPVNDNMIPTGEIKNIINTDFDFNQTTYIEERLGHLTDKTLSAESGYDHCYVIDHDRQGPVAELSSDKVKMSITTNQPGIQLCTASFLGGDFKPFQALCLETQNYPDAINHTQFPSAVLKPEERYHHQVSFNFSVV